MEVDGLTPHRGVTGRGGTIRWDRFTSDAFNVCAEAAGYARDCRPAPQCSVGDFDEHTCLFDLNALPPPPPPIVSAGEQGAVVAAAMAFKNNGYLWGWYGFSDFALFQRFLHGEDITPQLKQRVSVGANTLRVFAMFNAAGIGAASGLGELRPATYADYYARLGSFLDLTASFGLRVELVALADAQDLLPRFEDQRTHLEQVAAVLFTHPLTFLEVCNEPFKNGCDVERLEPTARTAGVPYALGTYDVAAGQESIAHGQYLTLHTERKAEWPRTARALGELRDGFDVFRGVHVPVVGDEPTGFAEVARGDSRSATPEDGRYFAATAALMGAGSTFHSDDGIASRLLGPVQLEAAREWFAAARWVPVDAQFSAYQRGAAGGGAGVGDMPIEHHDLDEGVTPAALRSFCKNALGFEWCTRIRPVGATVPRRGCTIVEEPRPGLVKLACPVQ